MISKTVEGYKMKYMSKSQVAECAGVSLSTFSRWCRKEQAALAAMGVAPTAKLLSPAAIRYLMNVYCFEV
jgi:transposase